MRFVFPANPGSESGAGPGTQEGRIHHIMKKEDELAMKVTKEIVIKFIETGRLSLNTFDEAFTQVHETVKDSLRVAALDIEEEQK
jgi:hypothetical protein